jgi:hypothetical protein
VAGRGGRAAAGLFGLFLPGPAVANGRK